MSPARMGRAQCVLAREFITLSRWGERSEWQLVKSWSQTPENTVKQVSLHLIQNKAENRTWKGEQPVC